MSRDIGDAHPYLQKMWPLIRQEYRRTRNDLILTCVHRSKAEQAELYAQGRTKPGKIVTWTKDSMHNRKPSCAIDVAVMKGAEIIWDEAYYYPLIWICEQFGLVSGGTWTSEKRDLPHIEMPKAATY